MRVAFFAVVAIALSSCSWVRLNEGAGGVRVLDSGASVSGCQYKGEISTSVTNRLAGLERNSIKVADELETLARNEAAQLGANTLRPESEPVAGEQRFTAYVCP